MHEIAKIIDKLIFYGIPLQYYIKYIKCNYESRYIFIKYKG